MLSREELLLRFVISKTELLDKLIDLSLFNDEIIFISLKVVCLKSRCSKSTSSLKNEKSSNLRFTKWSDLILFNEDKKISDETLEFDSHKVSSLLNLLRDVTSSILVKDKSTVVKFGSSESIEISMILVLANFIVVKCLSPFMLVGRCERPIKPERSNV